MRMKIDDKSTDTRIRLLEAAGETFARHGFREATVREISRRAGVNVAAVNYYFGDKESLYSAVLNYALSSALKKYPADLDLCPGATIEARLYAFIRSFLFRVFDEGRPAWHGKLMIREVAQPTSALEQMVEQGIRPLHQCLTGIVREMLGEEVGDEVVRLYVLSIIGQCIAYNIGRQVLTRLYALKFDRAEIEGLADHITRFSLSAIRAISGSRYEECAS